MECQIPASVHTASIRSVNGRAYGYMLLEIPGGPDEMAKAVKYLSGRRNVLVQVNGEYSGEGQA